MKALICPVSVEKINNNVARITGFMMASMIGAFFATDNIVFMAIIALDYLVRSVPGVKFSPFSGLAHLIVTSLGLNKRQIGKGQKIFAARIGLVFSLTSTILFYFDPIASIIVAGILMFFALLESLFDICAGCILYSFIIYPLFEKGKYNG
jgi:hypothetical protein